MPVKGEEMTQLWYELRRAQHDVQIQLYGAPELLTKAVESGRVSEQGFKLAMTPVVDDAKLVQESIDALRKLNSILIDVSVS